MRGDIGLQQGLIVEDLELPYVTLHLRELLDQHAAIGRDFYGTRHRLLTLNRELIDIEGGRDHCNDEWQCDAGKTSQDKG